MQLFEPDSAFNLLTTLLSTFPAHINKFWNKTLGDSNSLAKIKAPNMHCTPLIHSASHLVTENNEGDESLVNPC